MSSRLNRPRSVLLKRSHRVALLAGLMSVLIATIAWAGSVQYSDSHVTSKSPKEAWNIITAYGQICDSGCKYSRPHLVTLRKLKYGATPNTWYTWSHVKNTLKDAKYFTKVSIKWKADGNFTAENTQLTKKDKALIEKLEKSSGLKHSPVFNGGGTKTWSRTENGKTVVSMTMRINAGKFLGLWSKKIRSEMKKSMERTWRNIGG